MLTNFNILILASAAIVAAAPVSRSRGTGVGSFSVKLCSNPNYIPNGYSMIMKSRRKYGLEVSSHLIQKVAEHRALCNSGQSGSDPAITPNSDAEYDSPVQIQGKTFNLQFDTGSSDLWVFGSEIPDPSALRPSYVEDPNNLLPGATWNITYGDLTSANGVVYHDDVTVGGLTVNTAVEVAHFASEGLIDGPNDGLLGLGFGTGNTVKPVKQSTWFENIKDQLAAPVFAADLRHLATGSYDFGEIRTTYGDISYVPIDPTNGWYEFSCTGGFQVDGKSFSDDACPNAIADTGTALIYGSDEMASAYYGAAPESVNATLDSDMTAWYVNCDTADLMPSLDISVGPYYVTIPGTAMVVQNGDGTCLGGLATGQVGSYIYGDIFLKQIYAVFDYGNLQFGFAPKGQAEQQTGSVPSPTPTLSSGAPTATPSAAW